MREADGGQVQAVQCMIIEWTRELDEAGVVRLAELLALKLRPRRCRRAERRAGRGQDHICARADRRGAAAGRTPRYRARRSRCANRTQAPRLDIAHFDFYRLSGADEARELGFEDAVAGRRGHRRVARARRQRCCLTSRFEISLAETKDPAVRRVTVRGLDAAARARQPHRAGDGVSRRAARLGRAQRIAYLQGDASTRSYARLSRDGRTALLMDAPRQPDGPPIRDGKPYSQIAHLAEDMVRAFVAIAQPLRAAGLSAPEVLAARSRAEACCWWRTSATACSAAEVKAGTPQAQLWRTAVDALVHLRRVPVPAVLPAARRHHLSRCRGAISRPSRSRSSCCSIGSGPS